MTDQAPVGVVTVAKTRARLTVLILIGTCVALAVSILMMSTVLGIHEAISIEAGRGMSRLGTLQLIAITPVEVAMLTCCALALWKRYNK